ncbi:MAG TPA: hypothetical protein VFK38_10500 [Candidatus Limnocylindrales bacterium]|nr:hypothetical protein [Candidatus Limnocylindrales bacterium]
MAEPLSSLIRPELGPVLPSFARFAPPPPANLVVAELEGRSNPGDVVIDLHGRGGWIARAAIGRLRRSLTYESSALTRLLAEVVLRPPDIRHLDAAVNAMAVQPRGDVGLRQALNDMFASSCPTCGRTVVVDEFIWDGDADAPFRKSYRCTTCRDQVGGGEHRTAPTDAGDAERARSLPARGAAWASLLARFPSPDGEDTLATSLLDLYTPRSLVAIEAVLERLDVDLRAAPIEAALRLALLHVLLPASKLNSYPGRVAALRISHGRVRTPGERQWREHNPWHLFEEGCRLVRGFVQRLEATPGGPVQARLGDDLLALLDGSANVALRRGSPALRRNASALPDPAQLAEAVAPGPDGRPRVRLVLSQPPVRWTVENLSFAYLATSITLGRDATAELPLELLVGPPPRSEWGWEAATLRRSLAAVAPVLAPSAQVVVMLDPGGAEGLVAGALGAVGAGYRLVGALLTEGDDVIGGTLEFAPPGASAARGPRTRANVPLREIEPAPGDDDRDGGTDAAASFRLADVERAVTEVAVEVLRARGEPARFERLLGEVLVGLDRLGHLRRLVGTRTYAETEARSARSAAAFGLVGERAGTAGSPDDAGATATAAEPSEPSETAVADDADDRADRPREPSGSTPPVGSSDGLRSPAQAPADSPVVPSGADHVELLLELVVGELRRPDHTRLVELEPGRWWLRDRRDLESAALPLSDRVEWAVFSLLSTSGSMAERAFYDRVAHMFRGHDTPDEALVQACLESYRGAGSTADTLRTDDDLQARSRQHSELVGGLVEYGHRLGLRCWVGRTEQRHSYRGRPLSDLLSEPEQRAYLPLVSRGDVDALEETDVIWYVRGKAALFFEVEWTAMIAEPLLRRGQRIPTEDGVVRFLVIPPERAELVRFKLARSPLLRRVMEDDNWHILKSDHLRTLLELEDVGLDGWAPFLGLDPEIERSGEQLALFG